MYLSTLTVEGFRKLKLLELDLRPGLNVFVGPNNVGKTAVVDALRALLSSTTEGALRVDESDLHVDANGDKAPYIEFRFLFRGLTEDEEADFLTALKPSATESGKYEVCLSVRYTEPDAGGRLRPRRWCADHPENVITIEMLESLSAIYLPPLRDPSSGLRPSRTSQLARLAVRLSDDETKKALVETLKTFDGELEKLAPVSQTQGAVTTRHEEMLGASLMQALKIGLAPPDFHRLAARLSLLVESLDVEQNGLGFNNLIYMAVVLSELSTDPASSYKALIVEEPEAHLHPQLQAVLLDYLQSKEIPTPGESPVQVFVTSHSPHFASLASLDTLGCIHQGATGVRAFFPRTVGFEKTKKEKLQRYLDVTRAALFFAKRIVLVEGTAELFVVSALARRLGINLRKQSVSVLSTDGLNFDAFLPLFGESRLNVRVAVLTDGDPDGYPTIEEALTSSDAAKAIAGMANAFVTPFFAKKTLEYDLALHPENRPALLNALRELHPIIAKDLELCVAAVPESERAREMYSGMFERGKGKTNVQKGAFGQALAQVLLSDDVPFVVPPYIGSALQHIVGP